jgi:serine protease Do
MKLAFCLLLTLLGLNARAEDRAAKIREDAAAVGEGGYWIYNDLPKAFALAEATAKPLLVVFRCVP